MGILSKMTVKAPTLKQLEEILTINDDHFRLTYLFNVNLICNYSDDNITPILELRKMDVIGPVRDSLIIEVGKLLPSYAGRQGVKGQGKTKIIKDILVLSKTIAKSNPDQDIDSVYEKIQPQVDLSSHDALSDYVREIKRELDSTKSELESTKRELELTKRELGAANSELKLRVNKLEVVNEDRLEVIQTEATSDSSDGADEGDLSDTDGDSEASVIRQPVIPMKKKPKHNKLEGKPNQLEGIPRKGYAFIGNLKKKNTSKEVFKHVKRNSNVKVEMTDIQELKTNSDSKAFKVAVNKCEIQDFISKTKWPKDVRVEAFDSKKTKRSKPRQPKRNQRKNRNIANKRRQTFPNQNSQNYRSKPNRSPEEPYHYQRNYGNRYWENYQPEYRY